jgi:NAD(P)-dependent dehydrogenase (short-subunit alcohol dehydrogenase family)
MSLLRGRAALITGAGGGLGKAIATAFQQHGARVAINDVKPELAASAVADMPEPDRAVAVPGDIRACGDIRRIVQGAVDAFGGLDIVVNNAGVSPAGMVRTHPTEDWMFAFDVNVQGTFFVTQAALPYLSCSPHARVINISSEIAEHGMMYQSAYASSKGGVSALTRSLARSLGPLDITVNAICPGVVPETNLVKEFTRERPEYEEIMRFYSEMCPLPTSARAEHIAHVAVFLASDLASFVNSQLITVNGGTS